MPLFYPPPKQPTTAERLSRTCGGVLVGFGAGWFARWAAPLWFAAALTALGVGLLLYGEGLVRKK